MSFERLAFDANAAIDSFRSDRPFPLALRQARELPLPFFVLAELRLGAARSTRREESAAQVEALASRCRILTAGISTIDFYVRVRDQIERIWTMPQSPQKREGLSHDLWIVALCLENDAPLLTMDKLFDHVEGLRLVHCYPLVPAGSPRREPYPLVDGGSIHPSPVVWAARRDEESRHRGMGEPLRPLAAEVVTDCIGRRAA